MSNEMGDRMTTLGEQETPGDRSLHRGQAIRMRLGGSANSTEPFPEKPKGMHYDTYYRLKLKALLGEQEYFSGLQGYCRRLDRHKPCYCNRNIREMRF